MMHSLIWLVRIMIHKISLLIYRELKNMIQFKSVLLVQIVYPLSYFLLYAIGISGSITTISYQGQNIPFILFLTPGLIAMQTFAQFQHIYMATSNDRRFGVMKLLILGGIDYPEIAISKILLSFFFIFFQFLFLVFGLWIASGFAPSLISLIVGLIILTIAIIFWGMIGIGLGVKITKEEVRNVIILVITLPIMFSSSVFYNPALAPKWIYYLSRINPLTYTANALRDVFLNNLSQCVNNLLFLSLFSIVALIFSSFSFRKTDLPRRH